MDWDENQGKISNSKSDIWGGFFLRKPCANKKQGLAGAFYKPPYLRDGSLPVPFVDEMFVQKACCRNTVCDLILLKISSVKIFFSVAKVLLKSIAFWKLRK